MLCRNYDGVDCKGFTLFTSGKLKGTYRVILRCVCKLPYVVVSTVATVVTGYSGYMLQLLHVTVVTGYNKYMLQLIHETVATCYSRYML